MISKIFSWLDALFFNSPNDDVVVHKPYKYYSEFREPNWQKGCTCMPTCNKPIGYFFDLGNNEDIAIEHSKYGITLKAYDGVDQAIVLIDDMNKAKELGHLLLDIADWHENWEKNKNESV